MLSRGANGHAILGKVQTRMVRPRQSKETAGRITVDIAVEGYSRVPQVLLCVLLLCQPGAVREERRDT